MEESLNLSKYPQHSNPGSSSSGFGEPTFAPGAVRLTPPRGSRLGDESVRRREPRWLEAYSSVERTLRFRQEPRANLGREQREKLLGWIRGDLVSETRPAAKPLAVYRVAKIDDTSFGDTVRFQYRARVSGGPTTKELREISRKIINKAPPHNGMDILFYHPDSDINGAFTVGKAAWWPYGRIAAAPNRRTGDYSTHLLNIEVGSGTGIGSAAMPIKKRRQIFYEIVQQEDRGMNNESARAVIAKRYGISTTEAMRIIVEGLSRNWPFPPSR